MQNNASEISAFIIILLSKYMTVFSQVSSVAKTFPARLANFSIKSFSHKFYSKKVLLTSKTQFVKIDFY